ncbi:unnamed protein product [Phytophthora fragariaefolia]|uniref:Unnamed protein product n=1 Tax=Phytophthora fragariaefolia TaxID=1490495 RepID=A0A9W6Y9H0_9STRA|nr:unnamed protein product [Phytophthora fragariaefolia]
MIAPDVANPNFCYAELFLHSPWGSLDDLPQTDEECIAAFIDAQEQNLGEELLLESNAKVARQHHLELLKRSHIVQVLEHLPPSEYVFVDTSTIPTVESACAVDSLPEDCDGFQWKANHVYTPDDVVRARDFVKTVVRP